MSRPTPSERLFMWVMGTSLAVGAAVLVVCLSALGITATYRSIVDQPLRVVRCTKSQLTPGLTSECVEWALFVEARKS